MREGHQSEEHHGHGCEWFVAASFPYLEQSHSRSSSVDQSVAAKSFYRSQVEPNRCAVEIASISGDSHGRGASRLFDHNNARLSPQAQGWIGGAAGRSHVIMLDKRL